MESKRLKDIRFQAENRLRVVRQLPGRGRNGDRVLIRNNLYVFVNGRWRRSTEDGS